MENLVLTWNAVAVHLAVGARLLGLVITAPLFSSRAIPRAARIGLVVYGAVAVAPRVVASGYAPPGEPGGFFLACLLEAASGAVMGLIASIAFASLRLAAEATAAASGYGSTRGDGVGGIAPEDGEPGLWGGLFDLAAALVFLSTGGFQKLFINAFAGSFAGTAYASLDPARESLPNLVIGRLGALFGDAFLIHLPLALALGSVWIGFGLLARAGAWAGFASPGIHVLMPVVACIACVLLLPSLLDGFQAILEAGFRSMNAGRFPGLPAG